MKLLSIILILLSLQSWAKANDIKELQIEGISVGDSLLDHFSQEEILKNKIVYYEDDYFLTSEFSGLKKLENYQNINVNYKKNDDNFIIYAVSGFNFYFDVFGGPEIGLFCTNPPGHGFVNTFW